MTITLLIAALLPVVILLLYVYRKDKMQPEPVGQIVRAFLLGFLTVPLSFVISIPSEMIGLYSEEVYTVMDAFRISFFGAAIPEEAAKLFVLWLVLRKNKYFDEKMDGIVYAVCVSMGFAALENVTYLLSDIDSYIEIGVSRAFTAIPGHFCFGVVMGYYYSLAALENKNKQRNRILTFAAPVIVHGLYDSILFATEPVIDSISTIDENVVLFVSLSLTSLFIYFCFKMWKFGSLKIKQHIANDKEDSKKAQEEFNDLFKKS
jgi:RsiW-degrading membrane proteinase PrsW (M82 family)